PGWSAPRSTAKEAQQNAAITKTSNAYQRRSRTPAGEPADRSKRKKRIMGGVMSEHDEGRRAFIVGAVGAGAVAGTTLVQGAYAKPTKAKQEKPPAAKSPATAAAPAGHVSEPFDGHGVFFNDEHAATVAAFAERLMPGEPGKPGATEAN